MVEEVWWNKTQGWILPWDVTCTTGTLYSLERILMEWKQSLGKFGEAWIPCLWSMKIELMWEVPALHKVKAPFTTTCCEHQSPAHSAGCYSQNHRCKAPPSLVAAPLNSFENLSLGLSATNSPVELVSNALSGIGVGTLTVLWEARNRVEHIDPWHMIRCSQWILLPASRYKDTETACNGDPVQDHEAIVPGALQTERAQSETHYNMWLLLFFKAKLTFTHNSNLSSETLRALIPPHLHHQPEIRALEEMGTKRTYMSRGVWLRSGLAPCCCAWGCWEMMRDDLWSLDVTLWWESRGWEIVLQ